MIDLQVSELDSSERLLDNPMSQTKKIKLSLISSDHKNIYPCMFQMEGLNENIKIVIDSNSKIKMSFDDIINVITEDECDQNYIQKIKCPLIKKYSAKGKIYSKFLEDVSYGKIIIFPDIKYKKIVLRNFPYCSDSILVQDKKRMLKYIEFLMQKDALIYLKNFLYKNIFSELEKSNLNRSLSSSMYLTMKAFPTKKFLVILNPKAGKKNSHNIFNRVKRIFQCSNIICEVFTPKNVDDIYKKIDSVVSLINVKDNKFFDDETNKNLEDVGSMSSLPKIDGNKVEIINIEDIKSISNNISVCSDPKIESVKYNGIICFSGDGTVHHVINALYKNRKQEEMAPIIKKLPIGIIPCGSNNSLCHNILYNSNESSDDYDCQIDNCAYIIAKGKVKNLDIQEIQMLPGMKKDSEIKTVYSFSNFSWGILPLIEESSSAKTKNDTGFLHTCSSYFNYRKYKNYKYQGTLIYLPYCSEFDFKNVPKINEQIFALNKVKVEEGVEGEYNFVKVKDEFSFFLEGNLRFYKKDYDTFPKAKFNDSYCDLVFVKERKSNDGDPLYNMMMNLMITGDYFDRFGKIDHELNLEYIKTKLWRLVPKINLGSERGKGDNRNDNEFFLIDGEKYPICPVQVRTINKGIKVFSLKNRESDDEDLF